MIYARHEWRVQGSEYDGQAPEAVLIRLRILLFTSCLLVCSAAQGFGQFETVLVNAEGASAPCTGIGPVGGPLAKKCADMFQQAGFIKVQEVGTSGLTIGVTGKEDGVITVLQDGSPAVRAGLAVGDLITAVQDRPVKPTPGRIAARAVFGRRGETLNLKLRRNGADLEVSLLRAPQNPPQGPKSPNMFIVVKPLINWNGDFVPCMGAGPLAPAALEFCADHFKPNGFIKAGQLGATGFQLNLEREDKAIVSAVDANSAAAQAGIQVGDEIVAVNNQPLTASVGAAANAQLFGKAGDQFRVTVRRGDSNKTVVLQLAAKPQN